MPFKSEAQRRWMHAAEARGEVPKGTAHRWEHHTPHKEDLPEHVKKKASELTSKARNALSTGQFALPGRRYPIEDATHARNALARVSQHGSSGEKAEVRAKVHSRFPGIGEKNAYDAGLQAAWDAFV
jgi:hypothetical protein